MTRRFALLFAFLFLAASPVFAADAAPVKSLTPPYAFNDAFIRATPGKVSAAYIVITNPTLKSDVLVGATASWAGRIELHSVTTDTDGVMAMKPVHELVLPAKDRGKDGTKGTLALRPGGLHMMLFNLNKKLVAGQSLDITLNFRNTGSVNVPFKIQPMSYKGANGK